MTQTYEIINKQCRGSQKILSDKTLRDPEHQSYFQGTIAGRDRAIKAILERQNPHCVRELWKKPSVIHSGS